MSPGPTSLCLRVTLTSLYSAYFTVNRTRSLLLPRHLFSSIPWVYYAVAVVSFPVSLPISVFGCSVTFTYLYLYFVFAIPVLLFLSRYPTCMFFKSVFTVFPLHLSCLRRVYVVSSPLSYNCVLPLSMVYSYCHLHSFYSYFHSSSTVT